MMPRDLQLKTTVGLVSGLTVQFAEGRWPEEIGDGIALSEESFVLVEPHLRQACPEWTAAHRYGVFELSVPARASLVSLLWAAAEDAKDSPQENPLLYQLAEWLAARSEERPISVLGV